MWYQINSLGFKGLNIYSMSSRDTSHMFCTVSACPSLVKFHLPTSLFFFFISHSKTDLVAAAHLLVEWVVGWDRMGSGPSTCSYHKLILQDMLNAPLQCMHYLICYMIRYSSEAVGFTARAAQLGFLRDLSWRH